MYVQEEKMVQNAARKIELADETKDAARKILDLVKADKRTSLTAPEGKLVCDAYGIPVPKEGVAKSAAEASKIATDMGFSGGHEDRLAGYPAQDRSRRHDGGRKHQPTSMMPIDWGIPSSQHFNASRRRRMVTLALFAQRSSKRCARSCTTLRNGERR